VISETQVVTDETTDREALDIHGQMRPAPAEVAVLTSEAERMDLFVPVLGTVGAREHESVGRQRVTVAFLRTGTDDPHSVGSRHVTEEARRRPATRLGQRLDPFVTHRESGREHLGQHDETRAVGCSLANHRLEARKIRRTIEPHDVVLDRRNLHGFHLPRRSQASAMTSSRLQKANRTKLRPADL